MKVKSETQEFKPVSLTFDSREELELFFEAVEELYWKYDVGDPKRGILVSISNLLSMYTEDYDAYPKVL